MYLDKCVMLKSFRYNQSYQPSETLRLGIYSGTLKLTGKR